MALLGMYIVRLSLVCIFVENNPIDATNPDCPWDVI